MQKLTKKNWGTNRAENRIHFQLSENKPILNRLYRLLLNLSGFPFCHITFINAMQWFTNSF